mmetsp:Transcript_7738/g.22922  ORF Transcript_7738/g.22922 Transcript_7738/m.22922 type:complete len:386 (+) Transcript_7738:115-1272(+)
MCGSCSSCSSSCAIMSRVAGSSTYSTEARTAMQAANLASQRPAGLAYCCSRAARAFFESLKPHFFTKKSTLASPVEKRLSSSSSSSSSSTCSQSSSSSTSARSRKAVSSALWGRLGTAFTRALPFESVTVEIHSKAMARLPSGTTPLAAAKVNMMSTHSRQRGLKKVALSSAQVISACSASSRAVASCPCPRPFRAPSTMGSTGCIAWQLSASRTVIISQTRFRAATCSSAVPSPLPTRPPRSSRRPMTAIVTGVPTSSARSRRPLSCWTRLLPPASLNAFGTSSGHGPVSSLWAATAAMPAMMIFRTCELASTSRARKSVTLTLAWTCPPAFVHVVSSGPTLTMARRRSVAACVLTTSSRPAAGRRHSAREASTRPGSPCFASV